MESIKQWMRTEALDMADELVALNTEQFLKENIGGFGLRKKVINLIDELRAALFPTLYEKELATRHYLNIQVENRLNTAAMLLNKIVREVLTNNCANRRGRENCDECSAKSDEITLAFMRSIPEIRRILTTDMKAAYMGDPAAIYMEEILLGYPSIEAITVYRLANRLFRLGVPLIPRIMTEFAHQKTGIDIHPGATIGEYFFIDHGTGVVIGETCVIGNHVKLYQGVTLGAKSFELDSDGNPVKGVKRHPNIEDNVVIYSGATILGGDTTVGANSVIGGNVWLVNSVPAGSKVYNATPSPKIVNP